MINGKFEEKSFSEGINLQTMFEDDKNLQTLIEEIKVVVLLMSTILNIYIKFNFLCLC